MMKPFAWMAALLVASGLAAGAGAATPLYGAQGVSPQAVRQGTLGSCYFHASVAAIAQVAPDVLRKAISANPGGGYQVHFIDGPSEIVFPEDVAFGRDNNYDRSDGAWVAVLMRGYAQRSLRQSLIDSIQKSDVIPVFTKPFALSLLNGSSMMLVAYDRAVRSVVQQDGSLDRETLKSHLAAQLTALGATAAEAQMLVGFLDEKGFFIELAHSVQENGEVFGAYKSLGMGGIPVRIFEAFMGKGYAALVADHTLTMKDLHRFRAGRMALVAGTWGTPPSRQMTGVDWWVPAHCYTILSYDEAAQTVTLRNPWGARPEPDGVFTLPLAIFLQAYESYTYAQTPVQ